MQEEPLNLAKKLLETIGDTELVTALAAMSVARELFIYNRRVERANFSPEARQESQLTTE
jgi:hypothetical protein